MAICKKCGVNYTPKGSYGSGLCPFHDSIAEAMEAGPETDKTREEDPTPEEPAQTVAEYIGEVEAEVVDAEIPSEPGVYREVPFSIYRAIDAVNHGSLSEIEISPKQYQHAKEHGIKQTTAMLIGRAVHTMTLEPELFDSEYAIFEGKARRGKAWDSFEALNGNKDILLESQLDLVKDMSESLLNSEDPTIRERLKSKTADRELTMIWIDEKSGSKCKCRIDLLGGTLDDLKSTSAKTPQEFTRSAEKFSYHTQMAFYRRGMEANGHKCDDVNILAVQSVELLESFLVNVPAETLEAGDRIIDKWLAKVAECTQKSEWPGLGSKPHRFVLSKWAQIEAGINIEETDGQELTPDELEMYNNLDWSEKQ